MPDFTITAVVADTILYSGTFQTLAQCLQTGIGEGISFSGANLAQTNLAQADLDGGDFRAAVFTGANLCGANLSEALLQKADFTNAILYGATLCESDLTAACFDGALFGATEIAGSTLRHCLFSTLSAFDLDFNSAGIFHACSFINPCGTVCGLSRPPLVVRGLAKPVMVLDQHLKIGHDIFAVAAQSLRLQIEQLLLTLMMDDKRAEIA